MLDHLDCKSAIWTCDTGYVIGVFRLIGAYRMPNSNISNEPIQHISEQGRKVQVMVAAFSHHIYFGLEVLGQIISAVEEPSLVLITYHLP